MELVTAAVTRMRYKDQEGILEFAACLSVPLGSSLVASWGTRAILVGPDKIKHGHKELYLSSR